MTITITVDCVEEADSLEQRINNINFDAYTDTSIFCMYCERWLLPEDKEFIDNLVRNGRVVFNIGVTMNIDEELQQAKDEAYSAAHSANAVACSAADSARSAAHSAARSAANSAAAAHSAVYSAVNEQTEIDAQIALILEVL